MLVVWRRVGDVRFVRLVMRMLLPEVGPVHQVQVPLVIRSVLADRLGVGTGRRICILWECVYVSCPCRNPSYIPNISSELVSHHTICIVLGYDCVWDCLV